MASAEMGRMASALFSEANSRGPTAFNNPQDWTQLFNAHMEAVRVGLQGGGLTTANGLQKTAAEEFKQYLAGLREEVRQAGRESAAERSAMRTMQQAG